VHDGVVRQGEQQRSRIEAMIVGKSLYERPVAPGPPWNSVSPVKTRRGPRRRGSTAPGECPGVCSTCERRAADLELVAVGELEVGQQVGSYS
jgi:hypothetical protein